MIEFTMHKLRTTKKAIIELYKMQRYYGIIGNSFNSLRESSSVFFRNSSMYKHNDYYTNKSNAQFQTYRNLNEKLTKAINLYGKTNFLFKNQPSIIFISNFLPRYDKTSAEFRLYNILKILLGNDCRIKYIYSRKTEEDKKYTKALTGDITFRFLPLNQNVYHKELNEQFFDYLWITNLWVTNYVNFMTQLTVGLKSSHPSQKIIVDTMDFHYKEFIRKYDVTKNPEDLILANKFLKIEKLLYQTADTVIVVSEDEKKDIQRKISRIRKFEILPNIHKLPENSFSYYNRKNICFVGNFGNKHNIDAAVFFIENIFSLILDKNPNIEFHIIGNRSEKVKRRFKAKNVKVIGYVNNLGKIINYYKLFVCPMTYGTGMKGKIGMAAAQGLPFVTTSIGAEGFPVTDGVECFISDSPRKFADNCNQCLNDPYIWRKLSFRAKLMIADNFSPIIVAEKLKKLLSE